MGHKRLGILPKSRRWRDIVSEMGDFARGTADVTSIATNTLRAVQLQFSNLENDPSIKASFEFLLQVSHAFQKENPLKYLTDNKILDKEELSLLKLAKSVVNFKADEVKSNEYQTFARQAAIDAINNWYAANIERGQSLFQEEIDSSAIFHKASSGKGFCELSRLFFSKFTERYLKYFLEREASSVITNIKERKKFNTDIENHINQISRHAFETSKITQSYSAGWFNNHVVESFPDEKEIKDFLSRSFGKMKSELLQEEIS